MVGPFLLLNRTLNVFGVEVINFDDWRIYAAARLAQRISWHSTRQAFSLRQHDYITSSLLKRPFY